MSAAKAHYDVEQERRRQEATFGEQNHTPLEWLAILGEEVGEANHAVVETHFKRDRAATWDNYREELIHVAAVAIAAVECLDRQAAMAPGEVRR